MKTICLTVGLLLLLAACCVSAMPQALRNKAPERCCFRFYNGILPLKLVSHITMTNRSCQNKAFIVQSIRGKQICFSQTSHWAQDLYNRIHNVEGSAQQP